MLAIAVDRKRLWRRGVLQGDERLGGGAPQGRLLGGAAFHLAAEHAVTEVVEQQEAVVEILRVDAWHGEAGVMQCVGDGNEGAHILGEMREAAVGQAVADGGAIRLALPVHEDGAGPRAAQETTIAAHGRVALQVEQFGVVRLRDQRAHGDETIEARGPLAVRRERHTPRGAAAVIVKPHQKLGSPAASRPPARAIRRWRSPRFSARSSPSSSSSEGARRR